MSLTHKQRKARSIEHAAHPQPGDYWHECFSPQALVLEVGAFHVTYLDKVKAADDGWTWDTSQVAIKPLAEFGQMFRYKAIPGTWAHVEPNWSHFEHFRDEALAHRPAGVAPSIAMSSADEHKAVMREWQSGDDDIAAPGMEGKSNV